MNNKFTDRWYLDMIEDTLGKDPNTQETGMYMKNLEIWKGIMECFPDHNLQNDLNRIIKACRDYYNVNRGGKRIPYTSKPTRIYDDDMNYDEVSLARYNNKTSTQQVNFVSDTPNYQF